MPAGGRPLCARGAGSVRSDEGGAAPPRRCSKTQGRTATSKYRIYMAVPPSAVRRARAGDESPAAPRPDQGWTVFDLPSTRSVFQLPSRPGGSSQPLDWERTATIQSEYLADELFLGQPEAQLPDSASRSRRPRIISSSGTRRILLNSEWIPDLPRRCRSRTRRLPSS